jgi:hypothetical protein
MSKQPSLRDSFRDETGRQRFLRWTKAQLLSNLSDNGINCQLGKEANDFIPFTRQYTDLDLGVPDIIANRNRIVSTPLLQQALDTLKQASRSNLAQPCVKVEIQRNAAIVGFTLTVSLWFLNPDKPAILI